MNLHCLKVILILLATATIACAQSVTNSATPPLAPDREAFFRNQPTKAGEFRGAWIHSGYGIEDWGWDRTVAVLASNGFNAIIPNLLWGGVTHYPSKVLPTSPRVADKGDQVAACLAACRKYGIELHVWKVNFFLLHAPREFVDEMRAAGRTQKDKNGEHVRWLCPSHPENVALERDSMLELIRDYDVDGIHFDYIRYPDRNSCFCDGCKERFSKSAGVAISRWPDDVLSGEIGERYADWRRDQITRVVRVVSQEAHKIKPHIKVSAAVWGGWRNARQSIGQDAQAWIDAGYLDFVCPMNYEGDNADFISLTQKQVAATNRKIPLYIGIGTHELSGPEQLARQIQLTRELGADGFVLFQLNRKVATQYLPLLHLGATAAPPKKP